MVREVSDMTNQVLFTASDGRTYDLAHLPRSVSPAKCSALVIEWLDQSKTDQRSISPFELNAVIASTDPAARAKLKSDSDRNGALFAATSIGAAMLFGSWFMDGAAKGLGALFAFLLIGGLVLLLIGIFGPLLKAKSR
jgi:hypothetical protein